ncbi:hypothetical protein LB467_02105 [Salegentibacter sp. JZCK2]|uniref:hypothetical protein n=1 Tax=Salegentibacter tibetensis TaxID=2873600 RepID=UPI001CCFC58B|nr:hypothetical protein [Salegentibacter tibetensis]MBZ9728467.1 hypothetical protein [Salegentibacter tibetensis]
MKDHIKIYLPLFLFCGLFMQSCDDGDALIDDITENTTRGAILRTIEIRADELLVGENALQGEFDITLEVQDSEMGALVESVEVYTRFVDNTNTDGTDLDTEDNLFTTIPRSEFFTGEFGLPRLDFSIPATELASSTGVPISAIDGGDEFRIRFELVLEDGRRFSFDQNTGTLTGSFFRSPFQYTAPIVCAPSPPTAGEWTIELQDSYGDGWNGAALVVTIDGTETSYTLEDGASGTRTFNVPEGTSEIAINYVSGDWDSEVTFQVTSANGNEVLDLGPSPTAGLQLLDYCPNNL